MTTWMVALLLALQAHFAISYIVALDRANLEGWLPQLISWAFPWGQGDRGFLNPTGSTEAMALGFFIAAGSTLLSLAGVLSVLGIWLPREWWRPLAAAAAAVSLILLLGFFEPHKIVPILFNAGVLAALLTKWTPIAELA
jgi:hypothetical protein